MAFMLAVVFLGFCLCLKFTNGDLQDRIFTLLTDENWYNKRLRPFYGTDSAVVVNISMHLYGMSTLDDLNAEYQMQMLLRLRWNDTRLMFESSDLNQSTPDAKIVGDHWHASRMWLPDVHVTNEREVSSISKNVEGAMLMHIKQNGSILLSKRIQLHLICNMAYHNYPMDRQTCRIVLESSILSTTDMLLHWADQTAVLLNDNFDLPGFFLEDSCTQEDTALYKMTGNYSRLTIVFSLKRDFGHFLLDVYIPSILFVVTSWTSFWLDIPAAPARVSIGTGLMLTIVTSSKSFREKLPRYSYISALDVWNVICTGFVFASLLEYAVVNFIYHKDKRRSHPRRNESFCSDMTPSTSRRNSVVSLLVPSNPSRRSSFANLYMQNHEPERPLFTIGPHDEGQTGGPKMSTLGVVDLSHSGKGSTSTSQLIEQPDMSAGCFAFTSFFTKPTPAHIANGIDRKCRFIFPLIFLCFNLGYWMWYGYPFFRETEPIQCIPNIN